jgi:hypothetical protein
MFIYLFSTFRKGGAKTNVALFKKVEPKQMSPFSKRLSQNKCRPFQKG